MTEVVAFAAALAADATVKVKLLPDEVDITFASTIGYATGLVGVVFALGLRPLGVVVPIQACGFYFGFAGGVVGAIGLGALAIFQ
jgi:hypothetical protein